MQEVLWPRGPPCSTHINSDTYSLPLKESGFPKGLRQRKGLHAAAKLSPRHGGQPEEHMGWAGCHSFPGTESHRTEMGASPLRLE